MREMRNPAGTEFNMFAIQADGKDILYARTPELAKFVEQVMNLSGDVTAALIAGLKRIGEDNA